MLHKQCRVRDEYSARHIALRASHTLSARHLVLGWEKGGSDNHIRSSTNPTDYPSIVPTSLKPVLCRERIAM